MTIAFQLALRRLRTCLAVLFQACSLEAPMAPALARPASALLLLSLALTSVSHRPSELRAAMLGRFGLLFAHARKISSRRILGRWGAESLSLESQ